MKKGILVSLFVVVCCIVVVSLRGRESRFGNVDSRMKVGVILPLTGFLGYEGQRMQYAMELALDQVKQAGDDVLSLYYEDGKFVAKDSISAYNKLNNVGMDAWIVFGDTPFLAMKPLLDRSKVPVMCLIGAEDLIRDSRWLFHFSGSITQPARKMAEYVSNSPVKTVALLYLNEQIGQEVRRTFVGGVDTHSKTIAVEETFAMSDSDMRSHVAKVIATNPDAVFVYGYGKPYITILNELKTRGYKGQILTDGNLDAVKDSLIDGGAGIIYADFDFGSGCKNPATIKFIAEMKTKNGVAASSFSAFAYETIRILSKVAKTGGKNPEKLRTGLLNIKNYDSIVGNLSNAEDRKLIIPIMIKKATVAGADVVE